MNTFSINNYMVVYKHAVQFSFIGIYLKVHFPPKNTKRKGTTNKNRILTSFSSPHSLLEVDSAFYDTFCFLSRYTGGKIENDRAQG